MTNQGVFSGTDLEILKIGAIANDKYIQGMKEHPRWHGYFELESSGIQVNYVACYIYLTCLAKNIVGSVGTYTADNISGADNDCSKMAGVITPYGVNGTSWSVILSGYPVSQRNEQLAVYGMALHIATDTFAHSTFDSYGNRITHKEYAYPDSPANIYDTAAHNTNVYPNRYTCSKEIARTVLSKCLTQSVGITSDFVLGSYNGEFKLKNISNNIASIDSGFYFIYKTYFDNMNI